METSDKAKKLIASDGWEGTELKIYKDSASYPTIGVGHLLTKDELSSGEIMINGQPVSFLEGITQHEALDLLEQDLRIAEQAVNDGVKVPLNQNQFDALVSFVFNVGTGAFKNSTLLKRLNEGDYDEVPAQLRRWVRSGKRIINGLINRREKEIKLWNGLF